MCVLTRKWAVLVALTSILAACGGSKFEAKKAWGERTFTPTSPQNDQSYDIELRGQSFYEPSAEKGRRFQGLAPTALSTSLRGAKFEDKVLELRMDRKTLQFEIDTESDLRFQQLSEDGRYSINGHCLYSNCSQLYLRLEDLEKNEIAELQYSRSYEYLTNPNQISLTELNDDLVKEAIEFNYPVVRHTLRVNSSRDLDILIIERPIFEEDDVKVDTSEATFKSERVEFAGDGFISVVLKKDNKTGLRLTPNPWDAYDLRIDNQEIEPAQKIAAVAQAFVEQGKQVPRSACNIFVHTVLSLSGYTDGRLYLANNFHRFFDNNSQGLAKWERRSYSKGRTEDLNRLSQDLSSLPNDHAIIIQAINENPHKSGHTGILVKENDELVLYDSMLDKRGPARQVISADKLLAYGLPSLTLHFHPDVIR